MVNGSTLNFEQKSMGGELSEVRTLSLCTCTVNGEIFLVKQSSWTRQHVTSSSPYFLGVDMQLKQDLESQMKRLELLKDLLCRGK